MYESPYFSIALKMSDDSWTTLEHKIPESNKSVSWICRVPLLPVPATATKASGELCAYCATNERDEVLSLRNLSPRWCPASKILNRIWTTHNPTATLLEHALLA